MTYNSLSTASPDSREMQANPNNSQVLFKTFEGKLLLLLPRETGNGDSEAIAAASWPEIWQQLKLRLNAGETFWEANTEVELVAFDRLLDTRQLQEIAKALSEAQLQLKLINTSRRQTAVAAATVGYSVQQGSAAIGQESNSQEKGKALAEPLYLKTTVRSGIEIRHPGTVVIWGDLNPGGSVVARGDIVVWGRLRGVVHAGVDGNIKSAIAALQMEPTLIKIANLVARGPEKPPAKFYPEVAYVTNKGIRIARASEWGRRAGG
ncbi:MAG: septum site-determining protein MinC [Okeania sp. SIO2H7]|nr:septum site-determining protein MinC [Okeania sp. SIO2H7]